MLTDNKQLHLVFYFYVYLTNFIDQHLDGGIRGSSVRRVYGIRGSSVRRVYQNILSFLFIKYLNFHYVFYCAFVWKNRDKLVANFIDQERKDKLKK